MADSHTPGPWFPVPYGDGNDTVICRDKAGNQRIAFMAIPGSRDERERRVAWAEIKANARLIAAAPELLEALEDLCDFNTESTQDKWDRARDIIAKARGQ